MSFKSTNVTNKNQPKINFNAVNIPQWPVKNVQAISTSRLNPMNGNSNDASLFENASYELFNIGLHVGDNKNRVNENRRLLASLFQETTKIQWLEQVHGADVTTITEVSKEPIIADAVITRNENIALAIMTADCLPILLSNKSGTEIAAIHAGWKPLAKSIIANTLSKMETSANEIYAWLGPCISNRAFEVGKEVKDIFISIDDNLKQCFSIKPSIDNSTKYLADLPAIARYLLKNQGVKHIYQLDHCTYSLSTRYYSYRRENITGRMATIIART